MTTPSKIAIIRATGEVVYLTGCATEPPPFVPPAGDAHRPPNPDNVPATDIPTGESTDGQRPEGEAASPDSTEG